MNIAAAEKKPYRGYKQPAHVICYLTGLKQMLDDKDKIQQNRIQSRISKRKGVSHGANV